MTETLKTIAHDWWTMPLVDWMQAHPLIVLAGVLVLLAPTAVSAWNAGGRRSSGLHSPGDQGSRSFFDPANPHDRQLIADWKHRNHKNRG